MIRIRKAKKEEVPAVRELAIEVYTDTFAEHNSEANMAAFFNENYSLEKFNTEFDEPGSYLYIAMDNLKIVGFLRLRKNDEVAEKLGNHTLELQRLYVHKEYHGTSVAKKLMDKSFEIAQELKVEWLWLGVWEKNFRAQKFYSKFGFERFAEHVFQMGDDPQIDWLLKKKM
jgi:ribosomal protein S18 acetylase RimI-like enzyme